MLQSALARRALAAPLRTLPGAASVARKCNTALASRSWNCTRQTYLLQHQPARCISIEPLSSTPSNAQSGMHHISVPGTEKQLLELAADVSKALESTQAAELCRWASRINSIVSMASQKQQQQQQQQRVGVLYLDSFESHASQLANLALAGSPNNTDEAMALLNSALISSLRGSVGPVDVKFGGSVQIASVGTTLRPLGEDRASEDGQSASEMSFLSTLHAEDNQHMFVDWLYSCSGIVVVAGRSDVLHVLSNSDAFSRALQLHPNVTVALHNLDPDTVALGAYASLLREALAMVGTSALTPFKAPVDVISTQSARPSERAAFGDAYSKILGHAAGHLSLLASALSSAIVIAEQGGNAATGPPSMGETGGGVHGIPPLLFSYLQSSHSSTASAPFASTSIQQGFEKGDLQTVDASIGAAKRRIRSWFASGKIWQSAMMRVYEVSDSLAEDAILDRYLVEADLSMVHAAGRLNESIRRVANDLSGEINVLLNEASASQPAAAAAAAISESPSALLSAQNTLRNIALQRDPVDQFELSRHVWASQKQMAESSSLDDIPKYIHWSLAQFWAINASGVAGAVSGSMLYELPSLYAASGSIGVSLLAFVWLGRRWSQLESNLYTHLDASGSRLRAELANAHRSAIQAKLDEPALDSVRGLAKPDILSEARCEQAIQASEIAAWKARLASASP